MNLEDFAINTYEEPPQTIILRLTGEFDLVGEPALQEALDRLGQESARSLVVDLSEAHFMGVGSLRRVVLAGRGFASTEFRSPVPMVEKVLRLLGFIDGRVRIEGGSSRAVAPCWVDEVDSMGQRGESTRIAADNKWPELRASRHFSGARCGLKHGIVGLGSSGGAPASEQDAYASRQPLEPK